MDFFCILGICFAKGKSLQKFIWYFVQKIIEIVCEIV